VALPPAASGARRRTHRPEPIVAALTFFTPVGERELLGHSLEQLIARALKHPRPSAGACTPSACAPVSRRRLLARDASPQDPTADAGRIGAPLRPG